MLLGLDGGEQRDWASSFLGSRVVLGIPVPDLLSDWLSNESGGVVSQVVEAPGKVADQSEKDIHRGRLHVSSRLPTGDRVPAEVQKAGQVGLRELEAFPNRADLIGGKEPVPLAVDGDRILAQPLRVLEPQNDFPAIRATQM